MDNAPSRKKTSEKQKTAPKPRTRHVPKSTDKTTGSTSSTEPCLGTSEAHLGSQPAGASQVYKNSDNDNCQVVGLTNDDSFIGLTNSDSLVSRNELVRSASCPPRLSNESGEMFARFRAYYESGLDGGKRNLAAVARQFGVERCVIHDCSRRYSWASRCIRHDRERLAKAAENSTRLLAESAASQYVLIEALVNQLAEIVERASAEDTEDWELVDLGLKASKIVKDLVRTQRLIAGLSTSASSIKIEVENKSKNRHRNLSSLNDGEFELARFAESSLELIDQKLEGANDSRLTLLAEKFADTGLAEYDNALGR